MAEDTGWVQWSGRQALVRLPEHIGSGNAGQVGERLLRVISRGAVVLVADLTGTVSCDYSGADALARVFRRAVASGTELRLVVTAEDVRHVLRLNGLHRLIPVYPTVHAAFAAGGGGGQTVSELRPAVSSSALPGAEPSADTPAAVPPGAAEDLLDSAVASIFTAAAGLQDVTGLSREVIEQRITESLESLDSAIRDIRTHVFAGQRRDHLPGTVPRPPVTHDLLAQARKRNSVLRQQLAETTVRSLRDASAEAAALLARRRGLAREPHYIDYPTRIKRWQALADKADQLIQRWEGNPPADG